MERFSRARVRQILDLARGRLAYWERLGLVAPVVEGGRAFYSLQDLMALRTVVRLTAAGVPAARVKAALRVLAVDDPMALKKPLLEAPLHAVGGEVVQVEDGLLIEAASGQRILDLDGILAPRSGVREMRPLSVEEMMAAAMRADQDPTTWDQAAAIYHRVIEREPERPQAHINLGTLEFKRGHLDASEAAYRRALALDDANAVVRFNLANVLDEQGRAGEALTHLLAAAELDPTNPDVRYNLALLLDKLGRPFDARPHGMAYLQADPNSEWSLLARRHLGKAAAAPAPTAQIIPLRRRPR